MSRTVSVRDVTRGGVRLHPLLVHISLSLCLSVLLPLSGCLSMHDAIAVHLLAASMGELTLLVAVAPTHAYPELIGELGCPGDCGVLNVPFNANVDYKTGVFNASLRLNAPASEAYSKKLKAKPASWACPTCTLENYGGEQCEVCGAGRPSESEKNAAAWFTDQVEEDDTANAYMAPAKLPELVHLSVNHCDVMQMRGPTAHSNWVIPGRLLQGPHPGMNDDLESELVCLVGSGVTRFVSLATSNEMMSIGMYNKAAQVVASHINTKTCSGRNATLTRLQFNQVQAWEADQPAPEQELKILVKTLIGVLEGRDVLYVHCTNGHGRSGFMCALLLAQLYALNSYDALDRINRYHSSRAGTNDISGYFSSRLSPEMEAQLHQVVADNQESQEGLKEPLMQPGASSPTVRLFLHVCLSVSFLPSSKLRCCSIVLQQSTLLL